jgi:hypothetical protein
MSWMFLEVAIAFGLAAFIVWWTFPKKRDEEKRHGAKRERDSL